MRDCLKLLSLLISLAFALPVFSQELIHGSSGADPLYNKFYFAYASIKFNKKNCPSIRLPKRKYDSPLFPSDLIPFRTGYIVNSLTTSPGGGGRIDISYDFYYLNLQDNSLKAIKLKELDSIHSIITVGDTLYASGKKGNQLVVYRYSGTEIKELPLTAEQREDSFIKLAMYKDDLIALLQNGLIRYKEGRWETLIENSLQALREKSGFKSGKWLIPTENIRVQNDKLYFVHEITQQRTSYLYEIDLTRPQSAIEFFQKHSLTDNTKKEIDNYLADNKGNLYVTINRLMGNSILLQVSDGKISTIVLNGFLEAATNSPSLIRASAIFEETDSKLIFTPNGIFEWKNDIVTPVLKLERTVQDVMVDGGPMSFEFHPRVVQLISPKKYLVAGLWGGLYMIDLSKNKVSCLDDLSEVKDINMF